MFWLVFVACSGLYCEEQYIASYDTFDGCSEIAMAFNEAGYAAICKPKKEDDSGE